jgi:TonB-dependent SusC/RagA subfamily outer membrane receptor
MPYILQYLIKFSISMAGVYLFYKVFLRPLTFYRWNRFYLLGYSLLSFIMPFVNITPWMGSGGVNNSSLANVIPVIGNYGFTGEASSGAEQFTLTGRLPVVFFTGMVILLARLLLQYTSIRLLRRKAVLLNSDTNVQLYETDTPVTPFSFGKSIYFCRKRHSEEELQRIIAHEFVHVKQRHTIDMLTGELLCVVNWFNPFAWLVRHAIRQNLEFLADNAVLEMGVDKKEYQYLLLKVAGISQYRIASNFNFSNLKKRIAMMNKLKSARLHLTKFLFVLPLLAVVLLAFREKKQKQEGPQEPVSKSGFLVTDTLPAPLVPVEKPAVAPLPPVAPVPPVPPVMPKGVKKIVIKNNKVMVTLQTGKQEAYDLAVPEQKAAFEKKYGKLPEPPAPPVPVNADAGLNGPGNSRIVVRRIDNNVLFIVDGVKRPEGKKVLETIKPENIEQVSVLKDESAIAAYGEAGKNGVVVIKTKKNIISPPSGDNQPVAGQRFIINDKDGKASPLYVVDGMEQQPESQVLKTLRPEDVESVSVLKDRSAGEKYGDKGRNGVIEIKTKASGQKKVIKITSDSSVWIHDVPYEPEK